MVDSFWEAKINEMEKSFKKNTDYERWKKDTLSEWNKKTGYTEKEYTNSSYMKIKELYTKEDLPKDFDKELGYPGEYPYTRGVYPNMHRGSKLIWIIIPSKIGSA